MIVDWNNELWLKIYENIKISFYGRVTANEYHLQLGEIEKYMKSLGIVVIKEEGSNRWEKIELPDDELILFLMRWS
jgi:hypothetical protein